MKRTNDLNPVEAGLIFQASRGDLEAFNELVLQYQDLIFSRAYCLLGDGHSAEDATQECFLRAFQNIRGFRGGSLRAWLCKIVTNLCYDQMRLFRRHSTTPLIPDEMAYEEIESPTLAFDSNTTVQSVVERNELSGILSGYLGELPEIYRNPITLIDVHDFDYSEAAHVLGIPLGTLKSRLTRARIKMKEKLGCTFDYAVPVRPPDVGLAV